MAPRAPQKERAELIEHWRILANDAWFRYQQAKERFAAASTDAGNILRADGTFAYRQALRAENEALRQYSEALRAYTELLASKQ